MHRQLMINKKYSYHKHTSCYQSRPISISESTIKDVDECKKLKWHHVADYSLTSIFNTALHLPLVLHAREEVHQIGLVRNIMLCYNSLLCITSRNY